MRIKFTENNIPSSLALRVTYLTPEKVPGLPRGVKRITVARLFDKTSGKIVAEHASYCHERDNDNRKIGRAVAVGKAFKIWYNKVHSHKMPINKAIREAILHNLESKAAHA